jgi:hypothetical protein
MQAPAVASSPVPPQAGPAAAPAAPPLRAVEPPSETGPHFCSNCGHALEPAARFCPECGQRIEVA